MHVSSKQFDNNNIIHCIPPVARCPRTVWGYYQFLLMPGSGRGSHTHDTWPTHQLLYHMTHDHTTNGTTTLIMLQFQYILTIMLCQLHDSSCGAYTIIIRILTVYHILIVPSNSQAFILGRVVMKYPYWEGDLINLVKFNSNIYVIQLLGLAWHILPLPSAVFKTEIFSLVQ